MGKKVVIGIGNYLRQDDGLGPKVVEQMSLRELDKNLEIEDIATDGLRLLKHFNYETEKIVIIDSAFMGQKPGTIMIFSPSDVETQKTDHIISSHEGDILNLINLGQTLKLPIPEIKIVAVEPSQMDFGLELSEHLRHRIDDIIQQVIEACL